jgi:L-threonylcarbamoyladenylate synthase
MRYSPEEVEKTVGVLKSGGVILYPTDTVWGLGCDATNSAAVSKLQEIKGKSNGPFIVLIDQEGRLHRIIKEVPEMAWEILELSTSPTTLILPGASNLAPEVIAEDGSVGIRMVAEDFVKMVIKKLGNPIVSTSANFSGSPTPATFAEIDPKLVELVDYIVEYRRDDHAKAKASSIIKLGLKGEVKVIRS